MVRSHQNIRHALVSLFFTYSMMYELTGDTVNLHSSITVWDQYI